MARKTTPEDYARLLTIARNVCPNIAITTDIITGFPGESDEEFEASLAFVQQMDFAGGHIFTYSERPGTAAAAMPDQVHYPVRKERNARMRAILQKSARKYQDRFINATLPVLWESATKIEAQSWQLKGLTDNYLFVRTLGQSNMWNQITDVRLTNIKSNGLYGEIIR